MKDTGPQELDHNLNLDTDTPEELAIDTTSIVSMRDEGLDDLRDNADDFDISALVAMGEPDMEPSNEPTPKKTLSTEEANEAFNQAAKYFDGAHEALNEKNHKTALKFFTTAQERFDALLEQLPSDSPLRDKMLYPKAVIQYRLAELGDVSITEKMKLLGASYDFFKSVAENPAKHGKALVDSAKQFLSEIPDDMYNHALKRFNEARTLSGDELQTAIKEAHSFAVTSLEHYADQGNLKEAKDAIVLLGAILKQGGDTATLIKTMESLQKSITSPELKHSIQLELIKRLSQMDAHKEVITQAEAYLKSYGSSTEADIIAARLEVREQLRDAHYFNKDLENAKKAFEALSKEEGFLKHPEAARWTLDQALMVMQGKDYQSALTLIEIIKKLPPESLKVISDSASQQQLALVEVKASFFRGQELLKEGKTEEAYKLFSAALEGSSTKAYQAYLSATKDAQPITEFSHYLRGKAALVLGGKYLEHAAADFTAASKLDQLSKAAKPLIEAATGLQKAQALYDKGEFDKAKDAFFEVKFLHKSLSSVTAYAEKMIKAIESKK